jgi:3-methyladenine DNA glycosylase Tag
LNIRKFADIYQVALIHKGGEEALESLLPKAASTTELMAVNDADYLSLMSRRIFRAGLKHSLVDSKWPEFERQFSAFDPFVCAMMSDDFIDECMANKKIIRHLGKIKTVRDNAQFMQQIARENDSFGHYLASWPKDNIVGLWIELKKRGSHLGGNSGPYFLRMAGVDTFLLTPDVIAVLRYEGIISGNAHSQREMKAAQSAFLQWQHESGRELCEISRVLSCAAL